MVNPRWLFITGRITRAERRNKPQKAWRLYRRRAFIPMII
jgi:hypothetical protein